MMVPTDDFWHSVGEPDLAMQHAEQALDIDPKLPAAWVLRGRITENTP